MCLNIVSKYLCLKNELDFNLVKKINDKIKMPYKVETTLNKRHFCQAWWHMPVIPATQEKELGGLLSSS
jgi:hypothetical protein